jgi:hypothetical protein
MISDEVYSAEITCMAVRVAPDPLHTPGELELEVKLRDDSDRPNEAASRIILRVPLTETATWSAGSRYRVTIEAL